MSIVYIAPFFERNCLGEAATAYVKLLSKHYDVICRPIGKNEQKNDIVAGLMDLKQNPEYLVIHSNPEDFCWKSGFKKVIGITHLKNPLISDTNFRNYFNLMDEVYHDSSFLLPETKTIKPFFDQNEYTNIKKKENTNNRMNFLIVGNISCYEDVSSVIRAYSTEFRLEENVCLTVKIPSRISIPEFGDILKVLQNDTRLYNNPAYPDIAYNNMWFSRDKLLEFYNDFDCIINCSTYNAWSRPVIDCLMLGKRCILLLEEAKMSDKRAYGPSEHKDYPVGTARSFNINSIKKVLRSAFNGIFTNTLKVEDFTEEQVLTQLKVIFDEPQTSSEKNNKN